MQKMESRGKEEFNTENKFPWCGDSLLRVGGLAFHPSLSQCLKAKTKSLPFLLLFPYYRKRYFFLKKKEYLEKRLLQGNKNTFITQRVKMNLKMNGPLGPECVFADMHNPNRVVVHSIVQTIMCFV